MRALVTLALVSALVAFTMATTKQDEIIKLLSQQVMMQQLFMEERIRSEGSSGIKQTRVTRSGTRPYFTGTWGDGSVAAAHNHANNIRTVGLGEFTAVLNGVEFATRHNDYRLNMAHRTSKEWHAIEPIPFPEVPKQVTNKATVDEQVKEMREWFRAFNGQDDTIRPYQKYFKANLCYLEGAWTKSNGQIEESFDSDRHFIDASSWYDLQTKIRFTAYSGRKSPLENFAFLPTTIMGLRNGTTPDMAQWNYRILCQPLKDDLPTHKFRVVDDLAFRTKIKTKFENVKNTRFARFQLEPNTNPDTEWSKREQFVTQQSLLDTLMEQIPGKDNGLADIIDDVYDTPAEKAFGGGGLLNTGFYHRWFEFGQKDAMGLSLQRRGYSDEQLFMAQTTNPKVAAQRTEKCQWVGPRWKKTQVCAEWEQRWTWAIPLEIVYLTPLNAWNPYNIDYKGDARLDKGAAAVEKDANGNKRNGGFSADKAYNGTHSRLYYRTPTEFYTGNEVTPDAADTSGGSLGVLDQNGAIRSVRATGTRIILPNIAGVGNVRTRYPIMPVHVEGNSIYKELEALKDIVTKEQSYAYLLREKPFSGGETEDGAHTYRTTPSRSTVTTQHTHTITITADQFMEIAQLGKWITITSSLENGHQHQLLVKAGNTMNQLKVQKCDSQTKCWDGHEFVLTRIDEDKL